ncbi:hypothetical protein GmHk_03G006601 [Glycine max]|nr:hypothetical protein GmHk_03G006601 [Glycine max]
MDKSERLTYGGDERKMVDKINKMEHRDTVEIKEIQERFSHINVKGLGGGVKGKFVRQVIQQQEVLLLCIQKTKKESIDKSLCFAMWGNSNMDWVFQVHRHFVGNRFILLEGTWLENGVIVANAYLLCKLRNKKKLWDELRGRRALLGVGVWLETLIALEGWRKVLEMMMALTVGCFCAKRKIKHSLPKWNEEYFEIVEVNQKKIFQEMNEQEVKEALAILSDEDVVRKKGATGGILEDYKM